MIKTNMLTETDVRKVVDRMGCFSLVEYAKDFSVSPQFAGQEYFAAKMNIRKKQVVASLDNSGVIVQSGAMQMMIGAVAAQTNIQGAGDFMKKLVGSKVTGESTVKPRYTGSGLLVLEPTYKYIVFQDLAKWGGKVVVEDSLFLACEDTAKLSIATRNSVSSAVAGGEGFFNTAIEGSGVIALESPVPNQELIAIDLDNDVLRIDGSMAIAWSSNLQFTVERTTKTLVGSAASGEGLVNVYRGTGRVVVAPVA